MPGKIMIQRPVYQNLRMLNAGADGKSLCFHRDMAAIQHFKSVAGAVSYGKKHCRRRQFVNVSDRIADAQTVYFFVAEINVNQTIFKTVFTAERNDFTAYLLNNQSQPVGSEMGLGQIQYLIRRAGGHKLGKNFRRMNVFFDAGH